MPRLTKPALLAFAVLGCCVAMAPAQAEPALFAARDADTTVYLFGTIHYAQCVAAAPMPVPAKELPAGAGCVDWMSDTVEAALAGADELWIETTDITDEALLVGLIQELGYLPDGQQLTDLVPEAELRALATMTAGPMADALLPQLDRMQPWMASTVLGLATIMGGGASAEEGVDVLLSRFAAERDIPVRGFESGEYQVRLLAADPLELQVADLRAMTVLLNHEVDLAALVRWSFEKLWGFWLAGDLDSVAFMLLGNDEAFFEQYEDELGAILDLDKAAITAIDRETNALYAGIADPAERVLDNYERMIAQRNRNWIGSITEMMARPGTFFIAVGAGHLTGDAAVQVLLEQEGVAVTRVQ